VAQVPLAGAWTQEQLRPDLRVGRPVRGEPGDLGLLHGQVGAGFDDGQ
jgi:hypothetical protein